MSSDSPFGTNKLFGALRPATQPLSSPLLSRTCFSGLGLRKCTIRQSHLDSTDTSGWLQDSTSGLNFLNSDVELRVEEYCLTCCSNTRLSQDISEDWDLTCDTVTSSLFSTISLNNFCMEFRFMRNLFPGDPGVKYCRIPRYGETWYPSHSEYDIDTSINDIFEGEINPITNQPYTQDGTCSSPSFDRRSSSAFRGYTLTLQVEERSDGVNFWRTVHGCSVTVDEEVGVDSTTEAFNPVNAGADGDAGGGGNRVYERILLRSAPSSLQQGYSPPGWFVFLVIVSVVYMALKVIQYNRNKPCVICNRKVMVAKKVCVWCHLYEGKLPSMKITNQTINNDLSRRGRPPPEKSLVLTVKEYVGNLGMMAFGSSVGDDLIEAKAYNEMKGVRPVKVSRKVPGMSLSLSLSGRGGGGGGGVGGPIHGRMNLEERFVRGFKGVKVIPVEEMEMRITVVKEKEKEKETSTASASVRVDVNLNDKRKKRKKTKSSQAQAQAQARDDNIRSVVAASTANRTRLPFDNAAAGDEWKGKGIGLDERLGIVGIVTKHDNDDDNEYDEYAESAALNLTSKLNIPPPSQQQQQQQHHRVQSRHSFATNAHHSQTLDTYMTALTSHPDNELTLLRLGELVRDVGLRHAHDAHVHGHVHGHTNPYIVTIKLTIILLERANMINIDDVDNLGGRVNFAFPWGVLGGCYFELFLIHGVNVNVNVIGGGGTGGYYLERARFCFMKGLEVKGLEARKRDRDRSDNDRRISSSSSGTGTSDVLELKLKLASVYGFQGNLMQSLDIYNDVTVAVPVPPVITHDKINNNNNNQNNNQKMKIKITIQTLQMNLALKNYTQCIDNLSVIKQLQLTSTSRVDFDLDLDPSLVPLPFTRNDMRFIEGFVHSEIEKNTNELHENKSVTVLKSLHHDLSTTTTNTSTNKRKHQLDNVLSLSDDYKTWITDPVLWCTYAELCCSAGLYGFAQVLFGRCIFLYENEGLDLEGFLGNEDGSDGSADSSKSMAKSMSSSMAKSMSSSLALSVLYFEYGKASYRCGKFDDGKEYLRKCLVVHANATDNDMNNNDNNDDDSNSNSNSNSEINQVKEILNEWENTDQTNSNGNTNEFEGILALGGRKFVKVVKELMAVV